MLKNQYKVIGVMSGTSLDGIDLAECEFWRNNDTWRYRMIAVETVPYTHEWVSKLGKLTNLDEEGLLKIDKDYTTLLAEVIWQFIQKNAIKDIDFIASHGHTAKHEPDKHYTYQIGNLKQLAVLTNQMVVCDFRIQDVALKGQGAPLVPIGDELLFKNYDYCLNLGGFSNLSYTKKGQRIAYDICPVNTVLNHYANKVGLPFDDKGSMASSGVVDSQLLRQLNHLVYYVMKPPKSLGVEWVRTNVLPLIDSYELPVSTVLATFTEHIAQQILKVIESGSKILTTGGGAYNQFLIQQLNADSHRLFEIPDRKLIEYKEALIFGLLGVLRIRNEINCLSSVTGALKNHSSGKIYSPINSN
jgi:anhydro-N-acetylmuramic acid kinase